MLILPRLTSTSIGALCGNMSSLFVRRLPCPVRSRRPLDMIAHPVLDHARGEYAHERSPAVRPLAIQEKLQIAQVQQITRLEMAVTGGWFLCSCCMQQGVVHECALVALAQYIREKLP